MFVLLGVSSKSKGIFNIFISARMTSCGTSSEKDQIERLVPYWLAA